MRTLRIAVGVGAGLALLWLVGVEPAWAMQSDLLPETMTVRLRRVSGVMALIPAALLLILSHYRRREYVRAWVAVWLCLAAPLFLFSVGGDILNLRTPEGREARLAWGRAVSSLATLVWLAGVGLLAVSAGWVRGPVRWPPHVWAVAAALAILTPVAAVTWGLTAIAVPFWLAGLALFLLGAIRFLALARRERFAGALLMGLALSTVPIHVLLAQTLPRIGLPVTDRIELWIMNYSLLALGMHLLVFEDVTHELRRQNAALEVAHAELKGKAVTDALTGCYNRRFFDEIAAREVGRHQRYNLPLSLIFVDCDRFKSINDQFGHEAGDRVLAMIGQLLRDEVRQTDYVFRWGGDEFLVLVTCDEERAGIKAREIQEAFTADPLLAELKADATLSVGFVTLPDDARSLLPYVAEADERMYASRLARSKSA